jgi:hypothetical protein
MRFYVDTETAISLQPSEIACGSHCLVSIATLRHLSSRVCDQLGNHARTEQSATNKRYSWRHLYYTAFKNKQTTVSLSASHVQNV